MKKFSLLFGFLLFVSAEALYLQEAGKSFAAHMSLHMIIVAIAPALVAMGLPERILNWGKRINPFFSPLNASVIELIIVWGWHTPGAHHFARTSGLGFFFEQSSFALSGFWLWFTCVATPARGLCVLGLLLTSMHMTFLGALISLASKPLYHHSLYDQQLGGGIMLVIGGLSYLGGGLLFSKRILSLKTSELT